MRWQEFAQCRGVDTELFYPERGQTEQVVEAKAMCALCVVRLECLEFAVRTHQVMGIWGGLTGRERRRYRSQAIQLTAS